ncbi:hypothetical protein M441DRAFT_242520 [Trichoderma asperellum CBS 433.97]|uniref:ZZ-type domain-containing protein n=1 Tax=Trichoderma asperellum (strain ATCC 204424 / CBS 433.97 / NBRC 101777) TaxID=1042311 RepID=A0A2T3Z2F1_TRIA4|nr:hypothetical protein M441DRAFT_242520 [Trichoderma asperellum CBS 433.97]PTB38977.1 hypothetical protein M441DRAFT_242520 [Trichoderma asperellum CBS 433.97]
MIQRIYGFCYHCNECIDYDICWKCYTHKELVHFSDHTFDTNGPEFEDSPDDEAHDDASSDSSDSTDSDSDVSN